MESQFHCQPGTAVTLPRVKGDLKKHTNPPYRSANHQIACVQHPTMGIYFKISGERHLKPEIHQMLSVGWGKVEGTVGEREVHLTTGSSIHFGGLFPDTKSPIQGLCHTRPQGLQMSSRCPPGRRGWADRAKMRTLKVVHFLRSYCLAHSGKYFVLCSRALWERKRDFLLPEKDGDRENGHKEELMI